jgi:H+/Cl- antiporter ClcA
MNRVVSHHFHRLESTIINRRELFLCVLAMCVAVTCAVAAAGLKDLTGLITNIFFYGRFSIAFVNPSMRYVGYWIIGIPLIGGLAAGFLARYGAQDIRGSGVPETMENILFKESRIPPRVALLKPLAAAVVIGTGGPFGVEGPIIATGAAIGSTIGQWIKTSAEERKILVAAGAAAGTAVVFNSPIAAVLLAVELLLFELRIRSLIPVALAAVTGCALHRFVFAAIPMFPMPALGIPTLWSLLFYALLGAAIGLAASAITTMIYKMTDLFTLLPIHWMWWPAIGSVVVGLCGCVEPQILGVGYGNITHALSGAMLMRTMLLLLIMKWISWTVMLGSRTSGGLLAPLLTIGALLGAICGSVVSAVFPHAGISLPCAALVGMAALFACTTRAYLATMVFAIEVTLQPLGVLPLITGCTVAFLISCIFMRHSIITGKLARQGIDMGMEYSLDFIDHTFVRHVYTRHATCLNGGWSIAAARKIILENNPQFQHGLFPVVDANNRLIGAADWRVIFGEHADPAQSVESLPCQPAPRAELDESLRHVIETMKKHNLNELIVVDTQRTDQVLGMISQHDILTAHRKVQ